MFDYVTFSLVLICHFLHDMMLSSFTLIIAQLTCPFIAFPWHTGDRVAAHFGPSPLRTQDGNANYRFGIMTILFRTHSHFYVLNRYNELSNRVILQKWSKMDIDVSKIEFSTGYCFIVYWFLWKLAFPFRSWVRNGLSPKWAVIGDK